jgi:hypothetical protein
MVANGFWDLEVETSGDYSMELRRWPREADAALDEALPPIELDPERHAVDFGLYQLPSTRTEVIRARLSVGAFDQSVAVEPGQKLVQFSVPLQAGEVNLQTWFTEKNGTERGAYYVYIEKINNQ